MITEEIIDQILEKFEDQTIDTEHAAIDFAQQQPALFSMLTDENEGVLSDDEQFFLLYLGVVIFNIVNNVTPGLPAISAEEIAAAEEANWVVMDQTAGQPFHQRLDPHFENYEEEDLLAFVEDALSSEVENEDGELVSLTPEGVEPMFVMLKTMIDVMTKKRA
jgi:hypothetical protein